MPILDILPDLVMSIQYFPVIQGYDKFRFYRSYLIHSDWKTIPEQIDELTEIAEQLSVRSIDSFISISKEESIFDEDIIEELESESELINGCWYYQGQYLWSREINWFDPEDGLNSIIALLNHFYHLKTQSNDDRKEESYELENEEVIITELEDMKNILNLALHENRLFRICISS